MCSVMAVGMAVLSVVKSVEETKASNSAAEREIWEANQAKAADTFALAEQEKELTSKRDVEAWERMRQGIRERSKMKVALSESGGMGNSALALLSDSYMQEGLDIGIMDANLKSGLSQVDRQRDAVNATHRSRVGSANAKRVSPLMSALMMGSSAASGASTGQGMSESFSSTPREVTNKRPLSGIGGP